MQRAEAEGEADDRAGGADEEALETEAGGDVARLAAERAGPCRKARKASALAGSSSLR